MDGIRFEEDRRVNYRTQEELICCANCELSALHMKTAHYFCSISGDEGKESYVNDTDICDRFKMGAFAILAARNLRKR